MWSMVRTMLPEEGEDMMKWEEEYSGYHELVQRDKNLPKGNLVWATISERRTSTFAEMQMNNAKGFKNVKTFSWGGPLSFVSSRYRSWKRERALKKAKKWCEKCYQDYLDAMMFG